MIRKIICSFTVFLLLQLSLPAQNTIPSATDVVEKACEQAKRQHKNVFLIFHASWCVWCRKMDSAMNEPLLKKYFADNYVIVHLTVFESSDKKNIENPGAIEFYKKHNGQNQGLPFWLIFDGNQQLLADSKMATDANRPNELSNIGCPATKEEVDAFITKLQNTSRLKENELSAIAKRFRQNETN